MGADGKRSATSEEVDAPRGLVHYQFTFNKIDQFNKEALKHDLFSKSMKHNWAPKIALTLFSCGIENSFLVYRFLGGKDDRRTCHKKLARHLMAAGPAVRKVPAKHPPFIPVALSPDKRRHSGRLHAVSPAVPVTPKGKVFSA